MKYPLSFILNGYPVDAMAKPTDTLLDVLRDKLNILSAKRGCDSGECGACTILLNGEPARACMTIGLTVAGKTVMTLEGLTQNGKLHPLQQQFLDRAATQCGFCTPGMLISAKVLLDAKPNPSREEIVEGISGNLCRCGTYLEVIEAVQAVAAGAGKEEN
jgi:aerobic carbon-monoxide dehydrogenase small subunit